MSRLVTFGCSHTEGEGVENPLEHSWPAFLGKKLGMDVINLSIGGSSNRMIQHKVFNFDFESDDKVIILWTYPDRYHFFSDQTTHTGDISHWHKTNISKFWYKYFHTPYNEKFDNQTIVHQVNSYLDDLNMVHYNLVVHPDFNYYFNLYKRNFININFPNYFKIYPIGLNDHLGVEGNKQYAQEIYSYL